MSKPTVDELMADILEIVSPPVRENDEFTSDELAEKAGVDTSTILKRMYPAMKDGRVTRRKALVGGRTRYVYRKAK